MVSKGYSARQIALHWIAFVLVAFQWFAGDDMTRLFRAAHGGRPTDVAFAWTPVHIAVGVAILAVMLLRLVLRRADGAPPPPKQHPALESLASAAHAGLYLDLVGAKVAEGRMGCGKQGWTRSWFAEAAVQRALRRCRGPHPMRRSAPSLRFKAPGLGKGSPRLEMCARLSSPRAVQPEAGLVARPLRTRALTASTLHPRRARL